MIEQYTLMMLCEKYNINFNKLTNKNNNILDKGLYIEIDKTLNFLINELEISPENIEKCSSILYRNVDAIKKNILFLKGCDIHFFNVESCLHVLSTEPVELEGTYEYVKNNYGVEAINKNTSILSVEKGVIKEVEKLQLRLEKKGNLTIAASINFGTINIEEIQKRIQSEEFKNHPELFTSSIIAKSKSMIKKLPVLFDLAKQYNIEEYINTSFLLFSPSRNYALINYLIDNKIDLVIDGKLNPVFSKQPGVLKAKYNINIKELMHAYPFENYKRGKSEII